MVPLLVLFYFMSIPKSSCLFRLFRGFLFLFFSSFGGFGNLEKNIVTIHCFVDAPIQPEESAIAPFFHHIGNQLPFFLSKMSQNVIDDVIAAPPVQCRSLTAENLPHPNGQ